MKLFKSREQCCTKISVIKVAFDQRHFAPSPFPHCSVFRNAFILSAYLCFAVETECISLFLWWVCLCHIDDTVAMVSVCVTDTDHMTLLLW